MKKLLVLILTFLLITIPFSGCANKEEKAITAFCGAASKPAMDEAAQAFEKKTGIKVYCTYGGSGTVLSQMKLSKTGDLYIPGSPDYMVKAERDSVIKPESVKIVSYLIPVIAVQHGNPKNIQSLCRPGQTGNQGWYWQPRSSLRGSIRCGNTGVQPPVGG